MMFIKLLIQVSCFFFSPFLLAQEKCKNLFDGSLRQAQLTSASRADAFDKNLPQYIDIIEENKMVQLWSSKAQDPKVLSLFVPKDVSFIDHRLRESQARHLIKFPAAGSAIIMRAKYESQGQQLETNISFSKEGLIDNLSSEQKWLIGPKSRGAILFLHGGGTKSTGGHVAEAIINHFQKYNVGVISPDLPWHAEGPRIFMGTLDQEMLSLADLTKKYVHPDVPVFIWGHSWGGTFAHRVMQMSGERAEGFFHKNLKGLIITSPAVDPAPGKHMQEKKKAYFTRLEGALKREDEWAPHEGHVFQEMLLEGKTNPTGQFFASLTLAELDDKIPEHKGKKYLPSLMIVGKGDSLVYLGFEDLFHNYYDSLENVETHYLEKLPLITDSKQQTPEIVGHLLSDYLGPKGKTSVNFELALDFINSHTEEKPKLNKDKLFFLLNMLKIVQLWANDLSFREWAKTGSIMTAIKTDYFKQIKQKKQEMSGWLLDEMYQYSPSIYLIKALETITNDNFIETKKKLKLLENFFSNYSDFFAFLKAENIKEGRLILEKLSKQIDQKTGKKQKQKFLDDVFNLYQNSDFTTLRDKYFYLSDKDIEKIRAHLQENHTLEKKLRETYIPSVEDYKENGQLIDKQTHQNIQRIEENIQERLKLNEQIIALNKELAALAKQFNIDIDKIHSFIKKLKLILDEAFTSPPDFLKQEFENSEKEFLDLYEFSDKMNIKIEEQSLQAVEDGNFSLQAVHKYLAPHRPMIEEFNRRYDIFIKNRKKVRRAVIQAIQSGKLLSKEEAYLRQELYEKTGLYFQLNEVSKILAKKEAEKERKLIQQFELIKEYNQLLPYPALSKSYYRSVNELLDSDTREEFLEKNNLQLQKIINQWNNLNSQVLPFLPE